MTNDERIQKRIQRDKERKFQQKLEKYKDCNDISKVINMKNGLDSIQECKKSVNWKGTVHKYNQTAPLILKEDVDELHTGVAPKPYKTYKEEIRERGKTRIITPIAFRDRIIQRMICEYMLLPVVEDVLIYDNCASRKNKGTVFARERLLKFLNKNIKDYGDDFYILITDFKGFFDSIPHQTCYNVLNQYFISNILIDIVMQIIKSYYHFVIDEKDTKYLQEQIKQDLKDNKCNGLCLGSQISQILALLVPNILDHFIKDKCAMKFYIRYMDDSVTIHHDKKVLYNLYNNMKMVVNKLGLKFNDKKTKIVPARKGFTFLKIHYKVDGKKLISTISHSSVVRQRRKLKKLHKKILNGERDYDDVYRSMQSWLGTLRFANHHYHTEKAMIKLYDELFDGYKITDKYFKRNLIRNGAKIYDLQVLQNNKWQEFYWDWYE